MLVFRFLQIVLTTLVCWTFAHSSPVPPAQEAPKTTTATANNSNDSESNYLSSLSTVMITGAASQLGSFLAIALAEMFPNINLVLLDQLEAHNLLVKMDQGPPLESQFEPPSSSMPKNQNQLEESLARFEIKRQRITYVLSHVDNAHFFRMDYRPSLRQFRGPDRYNVLEKIFQDFNITHVVHLEDNMLNPNVSQVIPRQRNDDRMGYFDGILHQLLSEKKKGSRVPSLVYGSTGEIYNFNEIKDGLGREDWNVTYPSSIHGLEKLMMEGLAKLFSDVHDIFSIGLRFFHIYGPFGDIRANDPVSNLFQEIYQSSILDINSVGVNRSMIDTFKQKRDYIFIDDAVDAIISAMQVQAKHVCSHCSQIINVGTGQARSLSSALVAVDIMIAAKILGFDMDDETPQSNVVASMTKAQKMLGFYPLVTLEEGLEKSIRWYSERMMLPSNFGKKSPTCSCLDKGCLMDHVIFPCASEWADDERCTPSIYDNAQRISLYLTKECDVVQYKIELDKNLESIYSNNENCNSDIEDKYKYCNIAFIREDSVLVTRLKHESGIQLKSSLQDFMLTELSSLLGLSSNTILKEGKWTLIPVNVPNNDERDLTFTMNLPQFSPASFFSSKYAIYASEQASVLNERKLIEQFEKNSSSYRNMVMLIVARNIEHSESSDENEDVNIQQQHLYRSLQMALHDHISFESNSFTASHMIHCLHSRSGTQFRRELYRELLRWKRDHVQESIAFVLTLHQFWDHYLKSATTMGKDETIYSILTGNNDMNSIVKIIPDTNIHLRSC